MRPAWRPRSTGSTAWARALPGEYDDNFRLIAADGRSFVLKVMHPARERALVDLQCAALAHLEARRQHLPLPRVVQTRKGDAVTEVPGPGRDPAARLDADAGCRGPTLAAARPRTPELLAALGRLLGEMDRALVDFAHPAARRDFLWDLARAAGWIRELAARSRTRGGARWSGASSRASSARWCPRSRACAAA